jgi:copper chaperone CopZ
MTYTYHIQGMTCNGCKDSVIKAFQSIVGVQNVLVDLEKETATLTMNSYIATSIFKQVLPSKFTLLENTNISEVKEKNLFNNQNSSADPSKWEQLKPLFLIFACILLATLALNFKNFNTIEAMLHFMGLFFFVFSLFKFFDLKGFAASFAMYDPITKQIPCYGTLYPFIELILGFLLLAQIQLPIALIVTVVLLSITTIGVISVLLQKKQIQCACLGTVLKLPMTQATFIENSIMISMAVFILLTFNL